MSGYNQRPEKQLVVLYQERCWLSLDIQLCPQDLLAHKLGIAS
jgi:hypothetical protein